MIAQHRPGSPDTEYRVAMTAMEMSALLAMVQYASEILASGQSQFADLTSYIRWTLEQAYDADAESSRLAQPLPTFSPAVLSAMKQTARTKRRRT